MRIAALVGAFVVTFLVTILMVLFFTGNLNRAGIVQLLGRKQAAIEPAQPPAEEADPLIAALREKEQELKQRETQIAEEEKRLALMRKELESLRKNLDSILADLNRSLDGADAALDQRLLTVAKSVASMEAKKAAETLTSELFTPEEAAMILQRVEEDRTRGSILDQMAPEKAALVLQALKNPRHGS